MKKILPIVGLVVGGFVLFVIAMVVAIKLKGGVSPDSALTNVPIIGGLLASGSEPADGAGDDGGEPG